MGKSAVSICGFPIQKIKGKKERKNQRFKKSFTSGFGSIAYCQLTLYTKG
jgi:hypothetical protein